MQNDGDWSTGQITWPQLLCSLQHATRGRCSGKLPNADAESSIVLRDDKRFYHILKVFSTFLCTGIVTIKKNFSDLFYIYGCRHMCRLRRCAVDVVIVLPACQQHQGCHRRCCYVSVTNDVSSCRRRRGRCRAVNWGWEQISGCEIIFG